MPGPERPADVLGLDAATMRALGHSLVDRVVDRLQQREQLPAIRTGTPEDLNAIFAGPLPEQPGDPAAALATLFDHAVSHQQQGDHPRYFARVPGPASFTGMLGDWLATGANSIAASWAGGSGPAAVELAVLDWLRQLMGMPDGTEGVLVSGGSHASLAAFAAARATLGPGVAYLSDQTHASLARDLRALGWAERDIRVLPSDDAFRLPLPALEAAMAADRAAGRTPRLVLATAGTTNTGAVDPLPALADLCAAEGLWLHVDGAYGAPAALTETGRTLLAGMDRADSLVLDPHKWLFQPYDIGCLLVRHPGKLEAAFSMNPEYLRDASGQGGEVDFRNRSLELTRRARGLKLWLSLTSHGVTGFRAAIQYNIDLVEQFEAQLRGAPDTWEVVTPAQLGVCCFALRGENGPGHMRRARDLAASGLACVSTTELKGRTAFRLCSINPLTTLEDLTATLSALAS